VTEPTPKPETPETKAPPETRSSPERPPAKPPELAEEVLIEHFEGKFPTWLAPEQVRVLPISDKYMEYAEKVTAQLADEKIRVSLDRDSDKIGAKIRNARLDRVPYMLIIGQKEEEEQAVSVRHRDKDDLGSQSLADFVAHITAEARNRTI
jgi:threonyl-tRNA synthetase